jgi:nucleotide-binding universal stress UspA family protein
MTIARTTRRGWLAAATLMVLPVRVRADEVTAPAEVHAALPSVRLQGTMRYRWLGLAIYDARLWRPAAAPVTAQDYAARAFALELVYARRLSGEGIADRSIDEMRRLDDDLVAAQAEAWRAAMRAAFPDVQAGDRLVGLNRPGAGVRFLHNGRPTGEIADADFARLFFGIWLSPRGPEPQLRAALLGAGR